MSTRKLWFSSTNWRRKANDLQKMRWSRPRTNWWIFGQLFKRREPSTTWKRDTWRKNSRGTKKDHQLWKSKLESWDHLMPNSPQILKTTRTSMKKRSKRTKYWSRLTPHIPRKLKVWWWKTPRKARWWATIQNGCLRSPTSKTRYLSWRTLLIKISGSTMHFLSLCSNLSPHLKAKPTMSSLKPIKTWPLPLRKCRADVKYSSRNTIVWKTSRR